MPKPKRKTSATSLKMTPEVRGLWEQCAAHENRTLSNMFDVMVRDYARRLDIQPPALDFAAPTTKRDKNT